ncbi:hypothetical protein GCM10010308_10410 [Streptomyces vinaceusdrappus]|nr:hypothetical protein GCM10010301_30020 [Streptomyces plicatus]GHC00332.1 hypothetical protein GCM10010308_10410 [Streptomyces vinaceusdrappus]
MPAPSGDMAPSPVTTTRLGMYLTAIMAIAFPSLSYDFPQVLLAGPMIDRAVIAASDALTPQGVDDASD